MALHGVGALTAHHGCSRGMLVAGGLMLLVLVLLGVTNTIPLFVATVFFALFSVMGLGFAINIMRIARATPATSPHERLLNGNAKVIVALTPHGRVLLHGENWAATLDAPFAHQHMAIGERVRVVRVEGLQLIVTPTVEALVAYAQGLPHDPLLNP